MESKNNQTPLENDNLDYNQTSIQMEIDVGNDF